MNFEKENLIKKSKEEPNGVEREAAIKIQLEFKNHSFSLILNSKVCISSREKREKTVV